MSVSSSRRIVITGFGVVTPLGNTRERLWGALRQGTSGVAEFKSLPVGSLPTAYAAECREFTGSIDDFGPLDKEIKRTIKKGLKVMCREIQLGVAAAQLSIVDAGLTPSAVNPERIGVVYGCDYLMTVPEEFTDGVRNCTDEEGKFHFEQWGERGLSKVDPLWLLKFLPNMPASHIAIYNDFRGPNNSITLREASSNAALAESYLTIKRGHADVILCGATGSRIHPLKSVQTILEEEIATGDEPTRLSRPFDQERSGFVLGEGAAAIVLEELEHAQARGAKILGEVIGYGSSTVVDARGNSQLKTAIENAIRGALRTSGLTPNQIGHVHAHGLATQRSDREEAQAIRNVLGEQTPVVAAKSYFGNLGAASGMVELLASLLALNDGKLFPILNYETPDPNCPIQAVTDHETPAGENFVNLSVTPMGQATAMVVKKYAG